MGIVYRALDTALGRTVAIKTIALSSQGTPKEAEQLRERLMREAQAAATLSHPNVVAVYDVGQEGDIAYIVMEFVQGGTLDHAVGEPGAPRSPEALLKVIEEVAHALDYAHAHGIVHRDVKPGNIFIQEDGGVKLGDFGVAKVTWSRTMTEAGTLVGSPHYMAPEQLKGDRVTGRSDQFALAAVAYTLLAGRRPFDADTFATLASKILFEEAPSPSTFGVHLPPEVEAVLRKAMSKDSSNRFANCTEFVEALEDAFHIGRPAPVPATPPEAVEPRRVELRKWVPPATAVAAVLLVIVSIVLFLWMRQQREARSEAAAWESVRNSKQAAAFENYLKQYPKGRFVPEARAGLEALRKAASVAAASTKVTIPAESKGTAATQPGTGKAPVVKPVKPVLGLLRALGQRVNPKDGLVYVAVPPGSFQMGCSPGDSRCSEDEQPVHSVTLSKGFCIGQTEVTVEAYQRFARASGQEMPPAPGVASYWREARQPMLNVTWEEASAFCKWAGGQLPTEAQWEYAARAGDTRPLYGKPDEIAWYSGDRGSGNSDYKPHPVGQKAPNALGLYDMLGNAQELCWDSPQKYSAEAATDPVGPLTGDEHAMRGGGFMSSLNSLRSSFRYRGSGRGDDSGFRCVLPLK